MKEILPIHAFLTLLLWQRINWETTLKSATVIYPRVKRPVSPNTIPDKVWQEQNKQHITYSESFFTNDIIDDNERIYRLRAGFESKSYEISGIPKPSDFFFTKDTLKTEISNANEILFEEDFTSDLEKRLLSHQRVYFLNEDLTDSLSLGEFRITRHRTQKLSISLYEKFGNKTFRNKSNRPNAH